MDLLEQKEKEHAAFVEQMARSLGIPNLASLATSEHVRRALEEEDEALLAGTESDASTRARADTVGPPSVRSSHSSSPDIKARPSGGLSASFNLQNVKKTKVLDLFGDEARTQLLEDHAVLEKNETDAITLEREELKRLLYLASPFAKMVVDEEPLFM